MFQAQPFLRLLAFVSLILSSPALSQAGEPILIQNVSVVPMDREIILPDQDILVENGRIAAIGPQGTLATPPDARRVDGSGLFALPGLWESHAHITMTDSREQQESEGMEVGAVRNRAERRLRSMLLRGITSVRDPGMPEQLLPLARSLRSRNDLPELTFAGPVIDGTRTRWSGDLEANVTDEEMARNTIDRLAARGVDFVKIYNTVSPENYRALTERAAFHGLPIAGHIPFKVTARDAVDAGMRSIQHTYLNLVKDCTRLGNSAPTALLNAWIKEDYAGRWRFSSETYRGRNAEQCRELYGHMGRKGVYIVATPQMDLPFDFMVGQEELVALPQAPRALCEQAIARQENAANDIVANWQADLTEHYRELRDASVKIVAGSDAPTDCMGFGRSLVASIELFEKLGFSPFEALQTATVNAAGMAGAAESGRIAEGGKANLLLVGANPLDGASALHDVRAVMLNGMWVTGQSDDAVVYSGGLVWKDGSFEARELAIANGRFVDPGDLVEPRRVSLAGQYVVPAFGNAHAHLTSPNDKSSSYFLERGVYYVLNPNTVVMDENARAFFARKDTFDIALAQGGITTPGGHPEALYVDVLTKFAYPGKTRDDFFGNAFHYGRNTEEIGRSLDLLAAQGADYVKAYLLYSEQFDQRAGNPDYRGYYGLDPADAAEVVKQAAERDLRVGFHVETVQDLLTATRAGAHSVMHMPGHSSYPEPRGAGTLRIELSDDEAKEVAESGIRLVATYALLAGSKVPEESRNIVRNSQAANLRRLHRHGARFLIGTDTRGGIFEEVEWIDNLGAIPRTDLLRALFATGGEIFPHRKIGCLEIGCEADFLVLERDPVDDIAALRSITRRIKAGVELRIAPQAD